MEKQSPAWLTELLDLSERQDAERSMQMSKARCDQILQSVAVLELKKEEVESIVEHEQKILAEWRNTEAGPLHNMVPELKRFLKS